MAVKKHVSKAGRKAIARSREDNQLFVHVGHENFVAMGKVLAILNADSTPVKRSIHEAQKKGMAYDATLGRRTRSVVVLEGGFLILSSFNPDTVAHRQEESDMG